MEQPTERVSEDSFPDINVDTGLGIVNITVFDKSNFEDDRLLRPIYYGAAAIVAFVFAVDDPASFGSIEDLWWSECLEIRPGVPTVVIGCKRDTREGPPAADSSRKFVTSQEGIALANRIGAWRYFECSAKTYTGMEILLESIGDISWEIYHQKRKKRRTPLFEFSAVIPCEDSA
ncbi:hypothetical protein CTheo_3430 [Ceratobasidium theobromae]|uniref:Uncharacterized protein n=1 Tax=Ceratobasidium theobromae TaxID=1582974 RepID=A0A5N5QNH4_9AGAM|nr:hypothetical protein CTheo_3430 [Ceratobasidium theobromae]